MSTSQLESQFSPKRGNSLKLNISFLGNELQKERIRDAVCDVLGLSSGEEIRIPNKFNIIMDVIQAIQKLDLNVEILKNEEKIDVNKEKEEEDRYWDRTS